MRPQDDPVDKPEAVWGKAKTKNPVTLQSHKKHGADLKVTCHHTQPTLGTDAAGQGEVCFECHGAEAKDKQLTAKDIIHAKTGRCVACHKDLKAKDPGLQVPTACKVVSLAAPRRMLSLGCLTARGSGKQD